MADSKKILKGLFYTLGSGYVARAASVVLTFLIRREMGTDPFDATVWAMVVFVLLSNLSQFGLIHAFLHFPSDTERFVRTHFTVSLLISLLVFAVSCVGAFLIDYRNGHLGWTGTVILAMSGIFVFRSLSITPEAILRKTFEHRSLSLLHGFGTIAALSGTLWLAHSGAGALGLIVGGWSSFSAFSGIYVVLFALVVWRLSRLRIWPLSLDRTVTRQLLGFGIWVWLSSQLQNFLWYYDKLIMPAYVSATDLTLYENTWWLMQIPSALITHMIMGYTVTVYASVQHDREKLSLVYTRAATIIVRVSAPAALLLIVNAEPIVTLMGPAWSGSIPIFLWLAPYAFLRPLIEDGLGLLWTIGQTRSTALVLAGVMAFAVVAIPFAAGYAGVEGVAYTMGLVALIAVLGISQVLRRFIDLSPTRVFLAPLLAIAGAGLAAVYLYPALQTRSTFLDLMTKSALTSLTYVSILWIAEKRYLIEMWGEIRQIMAEQSEPSKPETPKT